MMKSTKRVIHEAPAVIQCVYVLKVKQFDSAAAYNQTSGFVWFCPVLTGFVRFHQVLSGFVRPEENNTITLFNPVKLL